MEQVRIILSNLLVLFSYFGIGIFCRKKKIITDTGVGSFSRFALDIALPCTIFQSFMIELTAENFRIAMILLLISAGTCALSLVIGSLLFRKAPAAQQGVMRYSVLISNCTFVGLPLMSGLCGPMGVFYTSIFVIPNRFFMWSAGVWMFSKERAHWRKTGKRIFLNPCMIACYLGTLCFIGRIKMPGTIGSILGSISACTAPLSMITIGAILADVRIRDVFSRKAWEISVCRLILLPVMVWGILYFLHASDLVIMVSVLMTGMPLANTVILLARQYGGDVDLAGGATLLSVLLSMVTIPLLTWML